MKSHFIFYWAANKSRCRHLPSIYDLNGSYHSTMPTSTHKRPRQPTNPTQQRHRDTTSVEDPPPPPLTPTMTTTTTTKGDNGPPLPPSTHQRPQRPTNTPPQTATGAQHHPQHGDVSTTCDEAQHTQTATRASTHEWQRGPSTPERQRGPSTHER